MKKFYRVYIMGYEPPGLVMHEPTLRRAMQQADCCIVTGGVGIPMGSKWTATHTIEVGNVQGIKVGESFICVGHELGGKVVILDRLKEKR